MKRHRDRDCGTATDDNSRYGTRGESSSSASASSCTGSSSTTSITTPGACSGISRRALIDDGSWSALRHAYIKDGCRFGSSVVACGQALPGIDLTVGALPGSHYRAAFENRDLDLPVAELNLCS